MRRSKRLFLRATRPRRIRILMIMRHGIAGTSGNGDWVSIGRLEVVRLLGPMCYQFPQSVTRRSVWALMATITVLADMSTAPIAAGNTIPHGASTPAASGMATML